MTKIDQSVAVDGSLHLSWTPPPTIDLTGVDPNLHYNVTIVQHSSTPSGVMQSTVSCEECPLSVPEYTFRGEANSCVSYTISVYTFNDAGRGESVSVLYSGNITAGTNASELKGKALWSKKILVKWI